MKRLIPPAFPVILLCLAVLLPGCPPDGGTIDPDGKGPDAPDVDVVIPIDTDVCSDCGEDTRPDVDVEETDIPDPCACGPDSCGVLPDCDGKSCGLCDPGHDCLNNECVPEGSPGTECEEDDDCVGEAPCLGTDPRVCGGPCDEDADCPKHMFCVEQPGDPDPIFTCIPGCPDGEGCSEASCGFVANGCGTYAPCGDCLGDNEICGAENLCVCEFEACGDDVVACCGSDETCTEGVCVSLCDPPCTDLCTECVLGNCLPLDCPPGTFCVDGICEILGLPCDGCTADTDCAPGLTCTDGSCRAETDANCDGCDDDGDGETDDDYETIDDCGEGVCKDGNSPSVCVDGMETPCQPGPPNAFEDVTCDGIDDDCNGVADEDYVPDDGCGEGVCQTENTPSTCVEAVETPCQEGPPNSDEDSVCDGVDDDCEGGTDEDYISDDTCGTGWCQTNNTPSVCVDGVELDCEPGPPLPTDYTCNNVDDDCQGGPDDDYIVDSSCGVGVCNLGNTPSSCVDGVETPCQPGQPTAPDDGACDGVDDDCDGEVDEDYVSDASCGVGYCQLENTPSFCVNGQETLCAPADPLSEVDDQCDYLDDDCDGEIDEDADPPCATGAPVIGADVHFLATLGLPSGIVSDNGNGTYSSTLVDLTNPNQDGALSVSCNGNVSDPFAYSVVAGDVAAVDLSLSNYYVCADAASVRACARLTDDLGAPAAIEVPVEFTLEIGGVEPVTQTGVAEAPGLSCAWLTTPGAVFASGAAGTVTVAAGGITSEAVDLDAVPLPDPLTLAVGEAGIRLPLCARLAGSTFEVPVTVNTGDSELGSYIINCAFDGNVLEAHDDVIQGAVTAMADPTENVQSGSVSFTGVNTELDGTAKGPSVEIALLSFSVKDTASTGDSAAVNCELVDLFNTNLVSIVSNSTVQIHDGDGQGSNGFVDALSLTVSGLFPTLSDNALIDMAMVSGDATVALVNVLGLMNDGGLQDLSEAPGTLCAAVDPGVAVSAGCAVTATGPGVTSISVSAAGHFVETPLWVLGPQIPGEATLTDTDLRYIPHIDRLQEARISVILSFTDGDLFAFDLDVTEHVGFASTVPAHAQVDDTGLVSGVGNGEATIVAIGAFGDDLGSASLQVQGGEDESVSGVHVIVPATVLVNGFDPVSVPDGLGEAAVEATITNLFDTDGQQVQASVLLVLSDDEETDGGSRIDVTGWKDFADGGATSFDSSDEGVITVDENGVVTAVGSGQATVEVDFENTTTGYITDGDGEAEVHLPPPQSVDLTVDDPRLAVDEANTAFTILGLPVERQLGVLVHFVNGTSKDFTHLPQTLYTVTGNLVSVTNFADCVGVPDCMPGVVSSTGLGTGTALVTVTFPGSYLDVVTADLVIEVVAHDELILKSVETYTPEGEEPVTNPVLSWVECTTSRQQSRLVVEEVFTDGSVVDLSKHPDTEYDVFSVGTMFPDDSVITVDPDTDLVTAVGDGTADVYAKNSGHTSEATQIQVDNAHLNVLALEMTYAPGATFHGIKDIGTGQLDVVATYEDSTRALVTGADFIDGLLAFNSDSPESALVDATGLMTAKGNGPTLLTVGLSDGVECPPADYQLAPGLALMVNLLPVAGDVDMGEVNGLAFPDQPADAIFEIPVRVNTGGADLGGVDLEIIYDPAVITPTDVSVGNALPGAIFSANLATPGTIYLNASPSMNTPVSGGGVEVAVITFLANKSGGPQVTYIGGTVVGIVDTEGAGIGTDTPKPIVAGDGQFDPPPGDIWGDANDDEIFSIADLLFVQQIIVDPPLVIPTPTQVLQSDLFPDGVIASNDAFYASLNLARLVHFVEVVVTGSDSIEGQSDITVIVTDRDQEPVDEDLVVRVELETIANLDTVGFTFELHEETASGVVTTLEGLGDGTYFTTVTGLMEPEPDDKGVGLVVILDLLGPDGEVLETTAFIQTPLVDPAADFVPIAYVDEICAGTCEGKACGDDNGCGSPCNGDCAFENQICINAQCVCGGISCAGKACGADDGCGSPCVVPCPDEDQECTPDGCECPGVDCFGDCCGLDDLGQSYECGEYPPGSGTMTCLDCEFEANCAGKACGDSDECGWYCDGTCPEINQVCNDDFVCVCGGDFCNGECCPVNHVCLDNECCEVLYCEGEGWECGAHYVGCSSFTDCGSCGLYGICTQEFLCECDYLKCNGACCEQGEVCDPFTGDCAEECNPEVACADAACGDDDSCGGTCEGPCPLSNEICEGSENAWSCGCVHEECNDVCCDEGMECDCNTGDCAVPCSPDCDGKFCGEDNGCCGPCHGLCPEDSQYCANGKCLCEGNNGFLCGDICCPYGVNCGPVTNLCDVPIYEPDCFGKACGADDGGGGICLTGSCPGANETCVSGTCVCEFAFCGGVCCDTGQVCDGDFCCDPWTCEDYGNPECGELWDGCGAYLECGACGENETCNNEDLVCECLFHDEFCGDVCCSEWDDCFDVDGQDECAEVCPTNCEGMPCGAADGCGGQCTGSCLGSNELCVLTATEPTSVWECQCQGTSCLGKVCGDDNGCGGICSGACEGLFEVCEVGVCVCEGNDGATCGPQEECCPEDWACVDMDDDGAPETCEFICDEICLDGVYVGTDDPVPCGTDDECGGKCMGFCEGVNVVCSEEQFICECAGDWCVDGCCPANHVCYLEECCEVDTCESLGHGCGAHYIGCGTFTDCGSCGDHGICNQDFDCECEYAECNGECCQPGEGCDAETGACKLPCQNSCLDKGCGELDDCDEFECPGPCPENELCDEIAPGDYGCGCQFVDCEGTCCPPVHACAAGQCYPCDPQENCADKVCGDDDGCNNGGTCYAPCLGLNEACDPITHECFCANGDLPCAGECCPYAWTCNVEFGVCEYDCPYDCTDATCGQDDGCDGFCDGTCEDPDKVCMNNANCVCPELTCGTNCCDADQFCDDGECCDAVTCEAYGAIECGFVDDGCGNPLDCGACEDGYICNEELLCECEHDVCNDACCGADEVCLGGACCAPQCEGKDCGESDLCGFLCDGPCPADGEVCFDGECLCGGASCVDKACGGDDGCGGVCTSGSCDGEYEKCANGICICANEDPECNGLCCPEGFFCHEGECKDCIPNCEGKACGDTDDCIPAGFCMGTCEGENSVCTDQFYCGCAGEFCDGECCPEHNVCVDGACCALESCDTVLPFGASCGTHDLGCDTLTSCGDCADVGPNMFCNTSLWTCECAFAECEGDCCDEGWVCWPGNGCVPCLPDCDGKNCGADDNCGGICTDGYCSDGLATCVDGVCNCPDESCNDVCCELGEGCNPDPDGDGECIPICVPVCIGKMCGDDDECGNACPGDCPGVNEVCIAGACFCEHASCDGDVCCDLGEACVLGECAECQPQSCAVLGFECGFKVDNCEVPIFCGACGVDQICDGGECLCAYDECYGFCCGEEEVCNDATQLCEPCPYNCTAADCGDADGCGGLCEGPCAGDDEICVAGVCECEHLDCVGACCAEDEWCIGDVCEFCVASCVGAECGQDNGCGTPCDNGSCPDENTVCQGSECQCSHVDCDGTCCVEGEVCQDGECICEFNVCGGICCADGDTCLGGVCCTPDCDDKLCGASNGCAAPCIGPCFEPNQTCDLGTCVCEFAACGDLCCTADEVCDLEQGECIPCTPACDGKVCGANDGCGNPCDGPCDDIPNQVCDAVVGVCYCEFATCGTACCAQDEACNPDTLLCEVCLPDCDGKACGDDSSCGYPCDGDCPGEFEVCFSGYCQCTEEDCFGTCCPPGESCVDGTCCMLDCDGKDCGEPDSCGGACQGPCPGENVVCAEGQCLCEHIQCFGECCVEGSSCANDTCCFPQTCDDLGAECGLPGNGCGNVQYCGACGDDEYCAGDYTCACAWGNPCGDQCCGENDVCEAGECVPFCEPTPCNELNCGADNGCGTLCLEGNCPDGWSQCYNGVCECDLQACGDSCCGPDEICNDDTCCPLLACEDFNAECGPLESGCGGVTDCGTCGTNQWCDELNLCYCTWELCGDVCCDEGAICDDGDACCQPLTCEDLAATCGAPSDGCGEVLDCGECPFNEACGVAFQCECPGIECLGVCCAEGVVLCDGPEDSCGGPQQNCDGKNCGDDDGNGGPCFGPCPSSDEYCDFGVCKCQFEECGDVCCPETDICVGGECVLCVPSCDGEGCGADDGCGGVCDGPCAGASEECVSGVCFCLYVGCEGVCCASDEVCGDVGAGELGCVEFCDAEANCADKVCGAPDGCGGSCNSGYCLGENFLCLNGLCECGGVTCSGNCCAQNEACINGVCECLPSCLGKLCGDNDGCDGTCNEGICPTDEICVAGICECEFTACVDACCAEGQGCVSGQCDCVPDCTQQLCGGSDGCGGICDGPCEILNTECIDFECVCQSDLLCGGICCDEGQECFLGACCDPAVCEDFPAVECGVVQDVCGGPLFCGACGPNEWCAGTGICECLFDVCGDVCCGEDQPCIDGACCEAETCESLGYACDAGHFDGCYGTLDCGVCEENAFCNEDYQCECEFVTCEGACCIEHDVCNDGQCGPCIPDCAGKLCGDDDGCDGKCDGSCEWDLLVCVEGGCECVFEQCGSTCCGDGQTCEGDVCTCPVGEDICGETCCGAGEGCGVGDVCECAPNCKPDGACGDPDGCGDLCPGSCPIQDQICWSQAGLGCACEFAECDGVCCASAGEECVGGQCIVCDPAPACGGKACGDPSGCGYPCDGPCPGGDDYHCAGGECVCYYDTCGDVCCGQFETCNELTGLCETVCVSECPVDAVCGDDDPGTCDEPCDGSCPGEFDVCEDGICLCVTDCPFGAACGDSDGCGGLCPGSCAGAQDICDDGVCVCQPACEGEPCGEPDGCDGQCQGDCPIEGQLCLAAQGLGCQCPFAECNGVCCEGLETCHPQSGLCVPCLPNCDGKACGDESGCDFACVGPCADPLAVCNPLGGIGCECPYDDCNGTCCTSAESCNAQTGQCEVCEPDCDGKACGEDNGCGFGCDGSCPSVNHYCDVDAGACNCLYAFCDGTCCAEAESCNAQTGECEVCQPDCEGAVCGADSGCDYLCDGTCPGTQTCDPADGVCGCEGASVACGQLCCEVGLECYNGECVPCVPDCGVDSICGDADGCDGFCSGVCPIDGQFCETEFGQGCICSGAECNGVCCDEGEGCNDQNGECGPCEPDCVGKACGDDNGCGFWCTGSCTDAYAICNPMGGIGCECTYDECNGTCCSPDEGCNEQTGLCEVCTPDCDGKVCGADNGCGYECDGYCLDENMYCDVELWLCNCQFDSCEGACCTADESCDPVSGECVICVPDCVDAVCGADSGCGYLCDGTCPGDQICTPEGVCGCEGTSVACGDICCAEGLDCFNDECVVCAPDCVDAICGADDGCGGFCSGVCPIEGQFCEAALGLGCVCAAAECDGVCCEAEESCNEQTGECVVCLPDCVGKACGEDNGCDYGCIGSCTDPLATCNPISGCQCAYDECDGVCCDPDETCDAVLGECTDCVPDCVDKACGADNDCGYGCDGFCVGENTFCQVALGVCQCQFDSCEGACCGPDEACDAVLGECSPCIADCAGAVCGDDSGCGYVCDGTCPGDQVCGPDGTCGCEGLLVACGDICCAEGLECFAEECVECAPNCGNAVCGDADGCGGFCNLPCAIEGQFCQAEGGIGCVCSAAECDGVCCEAEQACNEQTGECVDCVPDCVGKACGDDNGCDYGCTGTCTDPYATCNPVAGCQCAYDECDGTCCSPDEACDAVLNVCTSCVPDCAGAACGDDNGCGYECDGTCEGENQFCQVELGVCNCQFDSCEGACCGPAEVCDAVLGECSPCIADCAGAACGDDSGCGYVCDGTCPGDQICGPEGTCGCDGLAVACGDICCAEGQQCFADECVDCAPNCGNAACGDADGCGGFCSAVCTIPGQICQAQLGLGCVCAAAECNGVCCELDESCNEQTGQCEICTPDCTGKVCGDDNGCGYGCVGVCADPNASCNPIGDLGCQCDYDTCGLSCCGPTEVCDEDLEACVACVPDCDGKECGEDNGCGYGCDGSCEDENQYCQVDLGLCQCQFASCEGVCCDPDELCDVQLGECSDCIPNCAGADCGDPSGCGYPCDGTCPGDQVCGPDGSCGCEGNIVACGDICCAEGFVCFNDECVDCAPDCFGAACGDDDGCGGVCFGTCPIEGQLCEGAQGCACPAVECDGACCAEDEACNEQTGECVDCVPDCNGKSCGDDNGCDWGCMGPCTSQWASCNPNAGPACECSYVDCDGVCCAPEQACIDGECAACTPDCDGKACGEDNGCGYGCDGTCDGENQYCQVSLGLCNCQYDSCGGTCCGDGESCNDATEECEACAPDCDGAACGDPSGCGYPCDGTCSGAGEVCGPGGLECVCEDPTMACGVNCCIEGEECHNGICVDCIPACGDANCGDPDGCGGLCPGACTGVGLTCLADLGQGCVCLWDECDGACCTEEQTCNEQTGLCEECVPDCTDKVCGEDNGCGYACITTCEGIDTYCNPINATCECTFAECDGQCCGPAETCTGGQCTACEPLCDGKACGEDSGCGIPCLGPCLNPNQVCVEFLWECLCEFKTCWGKCCGAAEACDDLTGECIPE